MCTPKIVRIQAFTEHCSRKFTELFLNVPHLILKNFVNFLKLCSVNSSIINS